MIEYIKGKIVELTPATAILEVGNIGYLLQISINSYTAISALPECKLYVYEAIREDAHLLYGFSDKHERYIFQQLISVSGVGANTARVILSSLTVKEVESAIVTENMHVLKSVKGIGLKTAQRIIVDLKDKIKLSAGTSSDTIQLADSQVGEEAQAALVMLGFMQAASQKIVARILKDTPQATVEEVIKMALKML
ncbi:MAG: Holliday junction branch migration protein RuvA [Bacteroidales bacterium]|jgi:Holliday junction DNA helicase RuvA|nr:Holliday junction branch migration protein RuvA [Bacteroidales bacterium]